VLGLLLLSAVCLAFDPYDFMPCSFQFTTLTHVYSGGTQIATSEDAVYRDHDNLWRWESEFSGLSGLFDPHVWVIVWRPDNGASYHHQLLTGTCLKNNGASKMYPYPYEWVESKTDGIEWTMDDCIFDDQPAYKYTAKAKSTRYKFVAEANLFAYKKNGQFVFGNGTLQSNMIDLELRIDVEQYVTRTPLPPKLFQTSKPCPETSAPADPSKDFARLCYRSSTSSSSATTSSQSQQSGAGFAVKPSIVAVVASLVAALLMCIAL